MTADRHAAAKKAWLKRHRAQAGDHKETVQLRGDYGRAAAELPKADPATLSALISNSKHAGFRGLQRAADGGTEPHFAGEKYRQEDEAEQLMCAELARAALKKIDIPGAAVDGLKGIVMATLDEMSIGVDQPAGPGGLLVMPGVAKGRYRGKDAQVDLNAFDLTLTPNPDPKNPYGPAVHSAPGRKYHSTPKTLSHEIGHHAHLSKISDAAAEEWAALSNNGKSCRISQYGQTETTEHFAEAFAAYSNAGGDFTRSRLKRLEPKVHAFMERLWRDRSMWRPEGQVQYIEGRRGY